MVTVEIVTPMSDFVNELGGIAHIDIDILIHV